MREQICRYVEVYLHKLLCVRDDVSAFAGPYSHRFCSNLLEIPAVLKEKGHS